MGCCLTTRCSSAAAAAVDDSKTHSKPRDASPPPPLVVEEESVKEVLSETPVIPKLIPSDSTRTKITAENQRILLQPEEEFRSKNVVVRLTKNPVEENGSEISSEMYTCSASFSASTTITMDDDGEVTQKVNKLSPATKVRRRHPTTYSGDRPRWNERGIRAPPSARKSTVPSTDKKPQLPSRNITTARRHRNVVPSNEVRREPLARRSRSPAMRGEAEQLMRVKEKSPVRKSGNRVPVKLNQNGENVKLKKTNDGGVVPVPEPEPETGESLENPLVSLECFIFL